MTQKNFYIIPGLGARPENHWFPWLTDKINENSEYLALTLNMPNPEEPELEAWLNQLAEDISTFNENTYIVANSLGCITTLHYLNQLLQQDSTLQIGGLLLVSGFYERLSNLPLLDPFITKEVDFEPIKKVTRENILVVSSANDYIVPTELTDHLAQKLEADYYRKKENGHFLEEDGYVEFPLLASLLKNLLE